MGNFFKLLNFNFKTVSRAREVAFKDQVKMPKWLKDTRRIKYLLGREKDWLKEEFLWKKCMARGRPIKTHKYTEHTEIANTKRSQA